MCKVQKNIKILFFWKKGNQPGRHIQAGNKIANIVQQTKDV